MTATTKRKHVVKDMLEDFSIPSEEQYVVKVLGTPGSNLHEVITPSGDKFLCSLPTRFRKNIWIKRGDFVVVEYILEGDKVKAEIVRILYPQHVKYIKKEGCWPKQFENLSRDKKSAENNSVNAVTAEISEMAVKECQAEGDSQSNKEKYILNLDETRSKGDLPSEEEDYYSSEDDLSDIPANTNRPEIIYVEDTSDSDCSCDE